jgi:Flp pilus assembly protein TadD
MANGLLARPRRDPAFPATIPFADRLLADRLRALCTEAIACHQGGRFAEAVARYEKILSLKPDLPEAHNDLGLALAELGRFDAAIVAYQRAIELKPKNPAALCNWGAALSHLDRFDEAEVKFRRAIAINPEFAGAHHNLSVILKESGRLAKARQAAERAIRLAPRKGSYYEHLAIVRSFVAGDRYIRALESLAEDGASLSPVDRIHVHFALAKAYEDIGRPENAFRQLLAGNGLKRQQIAYDEATTLARMDLTRELFTPDFMKSRQGSGEQSRVPVFIVGMPRSGTTLIEQILASHPKFFGAGELGLFEQATDVISDALHPSRSFPEMILATSGKHFRALGAHYLDKLVQRAPRAARITDKMPGNFLYAGLIHLALPNAAIIHAVRDPIDTCASCFSINFSRGQTHTYDLAELGRYYRHYQALMAHWHRVLPPGRIIDVHYEDLVADLEGVARRTIAHCGLTWDARCLDFHRTERSVRTASAAQVRQPIYKGSVGRWRKYEKFLGPLLAELEPSNGNSVRTISNVKENMHKTPPKPNADDEILSPRFFAVQESVPGVAV